MSSFYYLVTLDPYNTLRTGTAGKYKTQLKELLGDKADYSGPIRMAMTKEQFALFLYTRCRMGGSNGMRELDMDRCATNKLTESRAYKLDSVIGEDEQQVPTDTAVELASNIAQLDRLVSQIQRGEPIKLGSLALNNEHMLKVFAAQRADLRARLITAISIPTL